MRFGIHGCMSNGSGLYDFYHLDAKKMKNIMKDSSAFIFMNFLIITFLEESYLKNDVLNDLYLSLSYIERYLPSLDLKKYELNKILDYLQKEKLINFEKIEDKDSWLIKLI
jgi:hypothetical protein